MSVLPQRLPEDGLQLMHMIGSRLLVCFPGTSFQLQKEILPFSLVPEWLSDIGKWGISSYHMYTLWRS
jgi:hypothetical protein